jgi:putative protease
VNNKLELVAPAGNLECARAAIANGANAIYFGLQEFNARMRADNFTDEQLPELVRFAHSHNVRTFCTFNTLIFTNELAAAEKQLIRLDEAGVDAIIVQDLGLAVLARELGVRFDVHASTQMTITSPEGVAFASRLGIKRVVLARETSLKELTKFGESPVSLETFVHGALCVAYSGQCLTSEALGQRSANRGECAQACRLPYDLIVDGVIKDLGDRRYLLSPQDLAAVHEIPELIRLGVTGFKIEGRLKSPEYVAATCQVYRKAIDAATGEFAADDKYKLEMAFSRGLYTGWMHGVNHQELVHARFGKKRGAFVGFVKAVGTDHVAVTLEAEVKAGDGIVFDTGGDTDKEQGGRVWQAQEGRLYFERGHLDLKKIKAGDRVWKTSDPQLERTLRKTFASDIPRPKTRIDMTVTGGPGQSLTLEANGIRVHSTMALQIAYKRPLSTPALREPLSRLGETDFELGEINNKLTGHVILPVSELNRLRRKLVTALLESKTNDDSESPRLPLEPKLATLLARLPRKTPAKTAPQLIALCRTMDQLGVALDCGVPTVYLDFEDLRRYEEAVRWVREHGKAEVFLATPRIQKAGEQGFFLLVENARPDGVLIRNLGGLDYFRHRPLRKVGDFSLNLANPLAADLLKREGLDRLTISYDCNGQQVLDLLGAAPAEWFELVIHQHMPMFHMEHCVIAAFLSTGTDHTNCGRPCDHHQLKLRDRVGMEHPLKADVGCRNTVFHARAQSGAEFLQQFLAAGARTFRVELLDEDAARTRLILESYRQLLDGTGGEAGAMLKNLNVVRQLGVTSGTLTLLG